MDISPRSVLFCQPHQQLFTSPLQIWSDGEWVETGRSQLTAYSRSEYSLVCSTYCEEFLHFQISSVPVHLTYSFQIFPNPLSLFPDAGWLTEIQTYKWLTKKTRGRKGLFNSTMQNMCKFSGYPPISKRQYNS